MLVGRGSHYTGTGLFSMDAMGVVWEFKFDDYPLRQLSWGSGKYNSLAGAGADPYHTIPIPIPILRDFLPRSAFHLYRTPSILSPPPFFPRSLVPFAFCLC